MRLPGGAGALLTTEVRPYELGEHGGHLLTAHVERRRLLLRLGSGRRWGLTLERVRPVAIEQHTAGGVIRTTIEAPPDPWLAAARRLLLWMAALWLMQRTVRAGRRRFRGTKGA